MRARLPARPNLEHLRTQAKALLVRLRDGDSQAARIFSEHLPDARELSVEQVFARGFRLADAQATIAYKTGFATWPGLARHVDRLRSMEGTWIFRSLEVDGQKVPATLFVSSLMLIDGDRFRMESPEASYEGIFTIDVERNPHGIDIDFVEGPESGNRCEGLFRLDGDALTFCLGLVGSVRPKQFATSQGSGHALEELVRANPRRPPVSMAELHRNPRFPLSPWLILSILRISPAHSLKNFRESGNLSRWLIRGRHCRSRTCRLVEELSWGVKQK